MDMCRTCFSVWFLLGITVMCGYAQEIRLEILEEGKETSIRGLSVVDDSIAWVSGSNGWVGKSIDRGQHWDWQRIAGHEETDFRDIEAFSDRVSVLLSAGSPLVILLTTDGGDTWQETYRDERPDIFFDGMDFWDAKQGIAYGDPIGGVMQLLKTDDGGRHWYDISPVAGIRLAAGEAGFAASGTGIRTLAGGHAFISSGGIQSRVFHSADYGYSWKEYDCPMIQGSPSTGIFSIAFRDAHHGVAVGGDYLRDGSREDVVLTTTDGGATWQQPEHATGGYRSSVEYVDQHTLIATGTSGVDISMDGGVKWTPISSESFHVVRKAKEGGWVVLAGADGRIATWLDKKDNLK